MLEAKRRQLQAAGYESWLNAQLNEVQIPLAANPNQRRELEEGIKIQLANSKQMYAAAEFCAGLLMTLPAKREDAITLEPVDERRLELVAPDPA